MKIAFFVHCFFPDSFYGTETYTLNLAKQIRMMGHEPIVISAKSLGEPRNKEAVTSYVYDEIPVYCIDRNYFPYKRIRDTYFYPQMRKVFTDLLASIKPELVHVTHLSNHTAVLLEVAAEHNIPLVGTFTDYFGFCFKCTLEGVDGSMCQGPDESKTNCVACYIKYIGINHHYNSLILRIINRYRRLYALGINFIINANRIAGLYAYIVMNVQDIKDRFDVMSKYYSLYDAVIAPTKFLRDAYIANGLTVHVHLIRFGIDLPRLPKQCRNGFPVRFGFIGQISHHKGTDILVEAFSRLPKGKAVLNIYGSEHQDPLYMERLKLMAKGHDVFFMGTFPSEKIAEVLSILDFLVIPSRWHENSPLVLLNALASHTPVVVSEGKGMTELIEEGKNGYVFPMGSVEGLEKVLKKIIDNPEHSREMFKTTEYTQTNEMMVEDVLAVYESVMTKG